jgi:hypothetical protein
LNKYTNASWPYPNVPGTARVGHECNGWDGFTFNKTLFPDPVRFFNDSHSRFGVKIILSVHMQVQELSGSRRLLGPHVVFAVRLGLAV